MKRIANAPLKLGRLTFRCLMKLFVDSESAFINAAESWPWCYGALPPPVMGPGRREHTTVTQDLDVGPAIGGADVAGHTPAKELHGHLYWS